MKARRYMYKKKYGLSLEDFNRMLSEQENKCAICGKNQETGGSKFPSVDHCHMTKKVRGLLCQKCNRGLGLFNDRPERLIAAAAYLSKGLTESDSYTKT